MLFALIILFCPNALVAQQQETSSVGKSDENLKSSARVNPSTLAMEFSLPLGVYGGRNGNSIPLNLNYSSKVWGTNIINSYNRDTTSNSVRYVDDWKLAHLSYAARSLAGWNTLLEPPKILRVNRFYFEFPDSANFVGEADYPADIVEDTNNLVQNFTPDPLNETLCTTRTSYNGPGGLTTCSICVRQVTSNEWSVRVSCTVSRDTGGGNGDPRPRPTPLPYGRITYLVKRIEIKMPDGSAVEFRKDDKLHNCREGNCFSDIDGTYLAVNGSRMRFERNELQPDGRKRDVLYLPDGSRYLFPFPETPNTPLPPADKLYVFIDVDGNVSRYDPVQRVWTDTIERQITNPFNPIFNEGSNPTTEGTTNLNLPGLPGQTRQAQFIWKKLKRPECETSSDPNCGFSVLENPAEELKYIGSDTCTGWNTNTNLPALFQGSSSTLTEPQKITTIKRNICSGIPDETPTRFNPVVLSEVILPDGTKYDFKYNIYGEITKIKYPTGAVERFLYADIPPMGYDMDDVFDKANRGVIERWVYLDEQTLFQHWKYQALAAPGTNYKVIITAPDLSKSERLIHRTANAPYGFTNSTDGLTYEERIYSSPEPLANGQPNPNGATRLLTRKLTKWLQNGPLTGGWEDATRDARPEKEVSIIFEGNKALATLSSIEYDSHADNNYFAHLNPKRTKNYHYISLSENTAINGTINDILPLFGAGDLATINETDYLYNEDYKSRNLTSLPVETRTLSGNNVLQAKSQILYDEGGDYSPIEYSAAACWTSQVLPNTCWKNPGSAKRGKATTTKVWNNITGNWILTRAQFDQFGNLRKSWDANNASNSAVFTETEYNATPSGSVSNPQNYAYVYPAKSCTPNPQAGAHGSNERFCTESTFDLTTGLALSSKDVNGQITTSEYNDILLRPTKVIPPAGAGQTITEYGDSPGNLYVKTKTQIEADKWTESTAWFDGLGRTVKTESQDVAGTVFTETKYDLMGRVEKATNPYRAGEQKYWTRTEYDEAGRVKFVYSPALNGQTPESKTATQYDLSTVPNYLGTVVTNIDAADKKSRAITNALGQVVRVDEATGNNDLGSLSSPNQPTFYRYDAHGKMVKVEQGGQSRFFLYDSLGRLLRVRQPEQDAVNPALNNLTEPVTGNNLWTAGFTYDNAGNLLTATDAKGVVITSVYDNLNRVKTRSYSVPAVANPNDPTERKKYAAATSTVSYKYDGLLTPLAGETNPPTTPVQFAKGKLTEVKNDESISQTVEFDNLGRTLKTRQITRFDDSQAVVAGQIYQSSYKYNLSGALTEQTYPSGRTVRNVFNADGDLAAVSSRKSAVAGFRTLASNFEYLPSGAVKAMRLGNNLWESAVYNNRQQLTQLGLGTSATNTSLWKINLEYGELEADGITVNAAKNAGNIAKQIITVPGQAQPFVQTYRYDSLDRLTEAKERFGTQANSEQTWKQTFGYDRFGNRTNFSQIVGTTQLALNSQTHPTINAANNRFNDAQGYIYDYNGNLIIDAENRSFVFNADNKQVEVNTLNASGNVTGVVGKYFYDGDGKRIRKVTGNEITIFVYDGMGKLIAEYAPPPITNPNPTTNYTTADYLGSPRIVSNQAGEVTSRRDFMPFGEELTAEAKRSGGAEALKYGAGADSIRKRFTGYEKDTETGLDFAEARYYQNKHGRFTAVDPLLASGKSTNPQTYNRYIYCLNTPVNCVDPSGLEGIWAYRNINGGTQYRHFKSQADLDSYNDLRRMELCKAYDCGNPFQVWTGGDYVLYADRTASRLNDDGTMSNFSLQKLDDGNWNSLVNAFRGGGVYTEQQSGILIRGWMTGYYVNTWDYTIKTAVAGGFGAGLANGGIRTASNVRNFFSLQEVTNLASPVRTGHILAGDGLFSSGGGHAYFRSIRSTWNGITGQKSMFPVAWSNKKIMNAVNEVATSPNSRWVNPNGGSALMTRAGNPHRMRVFGTYDGVTLRVIVQGDEIITAHPWFHPIP